MRKSEVQTHSAGYGPPSYPALNVKYYGRSHVNAVVAHFNCDDKTAEQACEFAWQSARENFWEQAPELARDIFGPHVNVFSAGRSGGWLIVEGLPDVESWDAIALGKWSKFARLIAADIKWRTDWEQVRDDIEANQWAKPGAELYNMVDTDAGTRCIADLKAEAKAAGFGPVIRK